MNNCNTAHFACHLHQDVHLMAEFCHLQGFGEKMYAFYSLLVYIFYTVFKKEEEDALEAACGASSDVCLATY